MGDVVNQACHLCNHGNQTRGDYRVMISENVYNQCSEKYKNLFMRNSRWNCYHGNIVSTMMNNLIKDNKV